MFDNFPSDTKKKSSHHVKKFILALSDFLRLKSLYNVDENFNSRKV